jgi:hypothetical protein
MDEAFFSKLGTGWCGACQFATIMRVASGEGYINGKCFGDRVGRWD